VIALRKGSGGGPKLVVSAHLDTMRSDSTEELLKLEAGLLDLVKDAVKEENARWNSDKIAVEIKLIGDRPAGIVALDSPIVRATRRAVATVTRAARVTFAGSSTDSNWAMSRGIPAVTTAAAARAATGTRATNGTSRSMPISARRMRC
jgi:di/tripeptidase